MKKALDPTQISNDLKGASLHFSHPSPLSPSSTPFQKVNILEENQQTDLLANQQTSKLAKKQTSKSVKKFGSYLREESIKALKRRAVEIGKKDYEVLQEAVDLYFASVRE